MLLVPVAIDLAAGRDDNKRYAVGAVCRRGPGPWVEEEFKVKGLRWLRAAAESDQSEAAGWREMPPPVGTRKKLTLTPARFRAQIEGIDAERRFPGHNYACGRRLWRHLRAE